MRSARAPLAILALLPALLSCATDVGSTGLAINDPLDLIDDVVGPLRLFVLPSEGHACDPTTGAVSPAVPDVEQGMVEEAIADVTLDVAASRARGEIQVPGGEYVVLVRGKGTDPVTGIPNSFIATGCASVAIGAGATVEIRITLIPIFGRGVCGDGIHSPDEQCEDGNTAGGDGCSGACRAEPFVVSTSAGAQENPSVGGASGRRWVTSYDDTDRRLVLVRLLEPSGAPVTSPSVLQTDGSLGDALPGGLSGQYAFSDVAVAPTGRIAISFTHFFGGTHMRVAFFDANRSPEAGSPLTVRANAGAAPESSVAFAGDGAFMVVFEDAESATGLSGQVFAAGSPTPIAADPFPVGQGAVGGVDPVVAGASDHFVVAFAAGGDVFVQRFGGDGTARDASALAVLEDASGTQDQPAVGALADGRALLAWREGSGAAGDGEGTSIRARAFSAAGAPAGAAFVLNTTSAGDQGAPSIAGGSAFVVAFQSGSSLRARIISGGGDPIPNREQPPTTADFEIAVNGGAPAISAGGAVDAARWMATWAEGGDIRGRIFPLP